MFTASSPSYGVVLIAFVRAIQQLSNMCINNSHWLMIFSLHNRVITAYSFIQCFAMKDVSTNRNSRYTDSLVAVYSSSILVINLCKSLNLICLKGNMETIREVSSKVFGFIPKHEQLETVNHYCSGKHCIVIAPTGWGKSFVYQIAPFVMDAERYTSFTGTAPQHMPCTQSRCTLMSRPT